MQGLQGDGVLLSSNNGNSWTAVNTNLSNNWVISLANKGDTIFAGTYNGGVFLSSNNGNSWDSVNTGLTNRVVHAIAIKGNSIFAGTKDGMYLSTNNGGNWSIVNNGLPTNSMFTAFAINDTNIYAAAYDNTGVYISTNNGSSWSAATGLQGCGVNAIAISGNYLLAGTTTAYGIGGVFLSTNNGFNWNSTHLAATDINTFAINGNDIFAGSNQYGVYLSTTDNGSNWTQINTGLTGTGFINALVIRKDTLYAGTYNDGIWYLPLETVGIKEINNADNIVVYPNPATNNITIEALQKSTIEILNIQGQTILQQQIQQGKTNIDISALAKGVYILRLCSNDKTAVTKIVKE